MGVHFTRMLNCSSLLLKKLAKIVAQLRVVRFLKSLKVPWPPSVDLVLRSAPYIFVGVYLPKLLLDIWTITRRVPIDDELQKESDAKLKAAVAKASLLLHAFTKIKWRVPNDTVSHKNRLLILAVIEKLLNKYNFQNPESEADTTAKESLPSDSVTQITQTVRDVLTNSGENDSQGGASGTGPNVPSNDTVHASADECGSDADSSYSGDDDSFAEPAAGSFKKLFELSKDLASPLATGDFSDQFDELHEKLTSISANVEVIQDKLILPPPQHPQHQQAEALEAAVTLVYHWFLGVKQMLVCTKTITSSVKKWQSGHLLQEMEDESLETNYWHATVPPREYSKHTGRKIRSEHWQRWRNASPQERSFWWSQILELRQASVAMLCACEDRDDERETMLAKLRKSKVGKIWHAVRLIIGSPANWAMVAGGWVGDLTEGMLEGAVMFYRSELLITAQRVSEGMLKKKANVPTSNVPYNDLIKLVSVIILTELAKIIVTDIKRKMDDLGESAIRRRLELLLGERLLAQDLELHDENNKANECSWGLTPQHLLRSFPIDNFINLPSTVLRVASTTATTAYMLWSKSPILFVIVSITLQVKQFVLEHGHKYKRDFWYKFLEQHEPTASSHRGSITIFQALRNFYDVRVNGCELFHLKQLNRKDKATLISDARSSAYDSIYRSFTSCIRELPTMITYAVGCGLIVRGGLAPSDLVMFPSSIQDIMDSFEELVSNYNDVFDHESIEMKQLDAIVELLNVEPTIGIRGGYIPESGELEDTSIEFKDVVFRRSSWPIRQAGLTFEVPSGSFVAVCGKNGVGKSTLFKLLLRLYDVDEGFIKIGGRNVKEYNPVWLRSKMIAMAPQKPGMYWGTLRSNLIYGSEECLADNMTTDDEVDQMLEKVLERSGTLEMFRDTRSFAQGFDTYKDPYKMSGGQQRAVGLARALFRNSKILLLDEPTNDLDPDRQQAVKKSLIEKRPSGQTVICITHELSTIQDADLIVFFDKDEAGTTTISGTGKYDHLITTCDTFRRWHEFKWPSNEHRNSDSTIATNVNDENMSQVDGNLATKALTDGLDKDVTPITHRVNKDDQATKAQQYHLSAPPLQRSMTWSQNTTSEAIRNPASTASAQFSPLLIREAPLKRCQSLTLQSWDEEGPTRSNDKEKADFSAKSRPWLVFRSAADFRGVQQRLDDMHGAVVERLLPQYETLLRQMRQRVREYAFERQSSPWSRLFRHSSRATVARSNNDYGENANTYPCELLPPVLTRRNSLRQSSRLNVNHRSVT